MSEYENKRLTMQIQRWVDRFFQFHYDTKKQYEDLLPMGHLAEPVEKYKDVKEGDSIRVTAREFAVKWTNGMVSDEEAFMSLGATIANGIFPMGLPITAPIPGSTVFWRAVPEYKEWEDFETKDLWKMLYMRVGWYYVIGS